MRFFLLIFFNVLTGLCFLEDSIAIEKSPAATSKLNNLDITVPYALCASTTEPPVIDGQLNDISWKKSIELGPFVKISSGELPRQRGRAYLLHDEKYLYIGVELDESLLDERFQRTHEIKREMKIRDSRVYEDDCLELFLQPEQTNEQYYHLVVNSLGTLYDARCNKDGLNDKNWNSNAKIAVSSDQRAWRIELAIPWSDFGMTAENGKRFRFNICRHECPNQEYTAWSPTGKGFHQPDKFGTVVLGQPILGSQRMSLPDYSEGRNVNSMTLFNPAQDIRNGIVNTLVKYDNGDWISYAQTVTISPTSTVDVQNSYPLNSNENLCLSMSASAAMAGDTMCFRSDFIPIKANTEYTVSAMVRADNLTSGERPLVLSLSSVNTDRKPIKSYEQVLAIPTGSYGWRRIEGRWRSAPNAAEILFWTVKWKDSGVTGKVWIDDIRISPAGSYINILPNGAIERDNDGLVIGWPVKSGWLINPSNARGAHANIVLQLYDGSGSLLYNSPVISREITKRNMIICSSLMLPSSMSECSDMLRVKSLYAAPGGYLYLPLVFRSSIKDKLDGCHLTLDVPAFLQLVDPIPRATILKRKKSDRDGQPYIRYELLFPAERVSPADGDKKTAIINHLLFQCKITTDKQNEWRIFYAASAGGRKESENEIPVLLLPPLEWKRPANVIIDNWACTSFYRPLGVMNEKEVDIVAKTFRMAGFNQTEKLLGDNYIKKYDFKIKDGINIINNSGYGIDYLAAHKDACAVDFSGKKDNTRFCPSYFLSKENTQLQKIAEWIEKEVKGLTMMGWDYEVPVTKPDSICLCDRCLNAFRKAAEIPSDSQLTAKIVLDKYRESWVNFRCRQNAEIAGLFRSMVKKGNPKCSFMVYSSYQGEDSGQYGVDWRYMSNSCDIVFCGYGRSQKMLSATHKAIGDRPLIGGELAWYGNDPYENTEIKTILFRRLTDCGSGIMTYFNWVVDGRFYGAVSSVACFAADFEPFFGWDVDENGVYHSNYKRDDTLVEVAGEGSKDDVAVLTHGKERLIFIFNEGKNNRKFQIKNNSWSSGMICLDYATKKMVGQKVAVEVPAHDIRIFHVVDADAMDIVEAPVPMSTVEMEKLACYPLLAWRGQGSRPGDQTYTLEISRDEKFPDGKTTRIDGIASTSYITGEGLLAGGSYFWRVRGKDVVSGKAGPYSAAVSFRVPLFKDVYLYPYAFNPLAKDQVNVANIEATLDDEMKWIVTLANSENKVVRIFTGNSRDINVAWDGKDSEGLLCQDGAYQYSVKTEKFPNIVMTGRIVLSSRFGLQNPSLMAYRNFNFKNPEGSVKLEKDYIVSRTGTYSIRMTANPPKGGAYWSNYPGGGVEPEVEIPVTPGKKYTFKAWVKTDLSSGWSNISLVFFTQNGWFSGLTTESGKVQGKSDWTERSVTLTAPKDAKNAILFFNVKNAIGSCWFDEVSFSESQ